MLRPGVLVPDFTVQDTERRRVMRADFFSGPFVLAFFPRASSAG